MSYPSVIPDDIYDKIEKYYLNGHELSDKETEICSRWESAFALLCKHKLKSIAIKKYVAINKVSDRQAYFDFKNAERVFTPIQKYNKEFIRLVIIESCMRDIQESEKRAKKAQSSSEWSTIMQIKDRAEKRIIKASGLDQYDPNLPDFSKLQPHTYDIKLPEKVKNLFKNMIGKGVVDITALSKNLAVEAIIVSTDE